MGKINSICLKMLTLPLIQQLYWNLKNSCNIRSFYLKHWFSSLGNESLQYIQVSMLID